MRYLLFLLLLISSVTYSQSNVDFRGDSARFYKNGGSMEVVIRNSTKDSTNGILVNTGNGVTSFLKLRVSNDSLFLGNTFISLIGSSGNDSTYINFDLPSGYVIVDGDTTDVNIVQYINDSVKTNITDTTIQITNIKQAIANRHYDRIVKVTSTIKAALAAITDASYSKRYMLYVPNGTYNEDSIYCKSYVDIVGESRDGVIVQSSSGDWDTFFAGGIEFMLANMTITHTNNIGDPGSNKYPVHIDAAGDSKRPTSYSSASATTILYNLNMYAYGTAAKAGLGVGLRGYQRLYVLECNATSEATAAIYAHNQTGGTNPAALYLINTSANALADGFRWQNDGSTADDHIYITGGEYSSITTVNGGSGLGEAYIAIDSSISTTITLVDATKRLSHPFLIPIPQQNIAQYKEFTGIINTDPVGVRIGIAGEITSLAANGRLFLANTSGNIGYFDAGRFRPTPTDYIISLSNNLQSAIQSVTTGRYTRITSTGVTSAQWDGTILSQYGPMNIGSSSQPPSSAVLSLSGTDKGFLPNVVTTTQRDAISTPSNGLIVYNSTTSDLDIRTGSVWVNHIKNQYTSQEAKSAWVDTLRAALGRFDSVKVGLIEVGYGGGSITSNTRVGSDALKNNTTGASNAAFGLSSLRENTTGSFNTGSGRNAGRDNQTGLYNSNYGYSALQANTGSYNTALGGSTARLKVAGDSGVYIGTFAAEDLTTGARNIIIGSNTGRGLINASYNVIIGNNLIGLPANYNGHMLFGDGNGNIRFRVDSVGNFRINTPLGSGTSTAAFEVTSTTRGALMPRMTTAQMTAISSPAAGLEVYNTTENAKMVFDGTRWTGFRFNGTKFQGYESGSGTWVDLN